MSNTRRDFLQGSAALAAGLSVAASAASAQAAVAGNPQAAHPLRPASELQVPKMRFFNAEIGRLVLGVNPFYGYSHYNNNFSTAMREWYSQDRVCEVMHQCNRFGIDAFNYVPSERAPSDWARFRAEGGKMHLIIQVTARDDAATLVRDLKPLALQRQGEVVDKAFQNGEMNSCEGVVQESPGHGCAGWRRNP